MALLIPSAQHPDQFVKRHVGPSASHEQKMLAFLNYSSINALIEHTVPNKILSDKALDLPPAATELEALNELKKIAQQNQLYRSYIGMGYYDCIVPGVIQRNILENPGWYTQYTPYQAEIAQGRMEALLNFQTMVADLTGFSIANASLLDEATAAAEAVSFCYGLRTNKGANKIFVASQCHPQTIAVIKTRARSLAIQVEIGDSSHFKMNDQIFAALIQFPTTDGLVCDYSQFVKNVHDHHGLVIVATDLLSLTLLKPPGEWGADVAIGSSQRFGVPLGYGGPHAAFFATKAEFQRKLPGRIIGVSKDKEGRKALRLSLQTREQHIRRDKATSNICTAQVLLAIMASMYAVYHGPDGLKQIALYVHQLTLLLAHGLSKLGFKVVHKHFFDTLNVELPMEQLNKVLSCADKARINFRKIDDEHLGISLDEKTSIKDLEEILKVFNLSFASAVSLEKIKLDDTTLKTFARSSSYLQHEIFNSYHSETEMLRYIKHLENKDLSLTTSMIALGSCTMKLNATAEMMPVTWSEFANIHPFAPVEQTTGYQILFKQLEAMLCAVTGFSAFSLQPNAGSQGEYTGLLVIQKYHQQRGEKQRNICLIPHSAHGTNPASAVMAGMKVVVVNCDKNGNIDANDLKEKAKAHHSELSALMITYPSTHGVFESAIIEICNIIHQHGGQVYMDGANMNAQIGLCYPGQFGPDVCHLNLHKTFCIPHGGGGPGMGPIGVRAHLVEFLPTHPVIDLNKIHSCGTVSAAPWGSACILPISWMYMRLMGAIGLKKATEIAILNANYIAKRLDPYYPVLYKGDHQLVAHECIIDLRPVKNTSGVEVSDVAKRLMDYGFHAPTVSFPVPGTMMIEPTESESKAELDRFCEAMIAIRSEIEEIEKGLFDKHNNLLKNAPHTATMTAHDSWNFPYSRERAVFPNSWVKNHKFWPQVARIDEVWGDRNLFCTCDALE